jgi:hypothetical protein
LGVGGRHRRGSGQTGGQALFGEVLRPVSPDDVPDLVPKDPCQLSLGVQPIQ